jgi:hypothetical protein
LRSVKLVCRADKDDVDLRVLEQIIQVMIGFGNRVLCRITLARPALLLSTAVIVQSDCERIAAIIRVLAISLAPISAHFRGRGGMGDVKGAATAKARDLPNKRG